MAVPIRETPPPPDRYRWLYATKPTGWTLFLRTFVPYQIWKFIRINLKMLTIIARRHGAR